MRKTILTLILFVVPVIFLSCGDDENKPDYVSMLEDTVKYIETLEKENEDLKEESSIKTDAGEGKEKKGRKESDEIEDQLERLMVINEDLVTEKRGLERQLRKLQATKGVGTKSSTKTAPGKGNADNKKFLSEIALLEKEVADLRKKEKRAQASINKIEALEAEKLALEKKMEDAQDQIADLEKELQESAMRVKDLESENQMLAKFKANMVNRLKEISDLTQ